jgi:hypothetical protein
VNNNWVGVMLALFTTSGLLASDAAFESVIGGSAGTLIVGVPTSDGLVIAADTRRTVNGVACDFGTKLYVPRNLHSTVFGFTGLSGFYAVKPFSTCAEIEAAPVLFNIEPIVRNFLERQSSSIRQLDLIALSNECVAAFSRFVASSGPLIDRPSLVARSSVFTVVLAAYEPDTRTSIMREISFRMPSSNQISSDQSVFASYDAKGQPDWRAFGQGQYLVDQVLNGPGKQFLSNRYKEFEQAGKISDLASELATEVAENLIDATSKTSEIVPIPAGVGGRTDVYCLSGDGAEKIR